MAQELVHSFLSQWLSGRWKSSQFFIFMAILSKKKFTVFHFFGQNSCHFSLILVHHTSHLKAICTRKGFWAVQTQCIWALHMCYRPKASVGCMQCNGHIAQHLCHLGHICPHKSLFEQENKLCCQFYFVFYWKWHTRAVGTAHLMVVFIQIGLGWAWLVSFSTKFGTHGL